MKRGTPRHPKFRDLCEQLNCPVPLAVGYLELLWHFTAEFAPQGDIGRYSDKRIEGALEWRKGSGLLVGVLTTSGWIEAHPHLRLIVHHWHQHCDDSVRKKLARLGLSFLTDIAKVTGHRRNVSDEPGGQKLPALPSLALPTPHPLPEGSAVAESVVPLSHSEYPLTRAEIRRHDPAVDDLFVIRLMQTCIQQCLSSREFPQGKLDLVTDKVVAKACAESYATGPRNHGSGLLLNRVPPILISWSVS